MGLDFLDMTFRLEKSFGIKIPAGRFFPNADQPQPTDLQARAIFETVCDVLGENGKPIPASSWHRVQLAIARACGVSPSKVKPESWLVKDLGCS